MLVIALATNTLADAAAIYSDTFSRTDSATVGTNDNGLGGTIVATWIEREPAGGDNVAFILSQRVALKNEDPVNSTFITPNHNFTDAAITSAGGMALDLDFEFPGAPTTRWLGISLGYNQGFPSRVATSAGKAFSILLTFDGRYSTYPNSNMPMVDRLVRPSGAHLQLTLTTASFSAGSLAVVHGAISGTVLDLNGAAAGDDYTFTWGTDAVAGFNGIALETNSSVEVRVDNFLISTIPEPSVPACLVLGAFMMLGFRRCGRNPQAIAVARFGSIDLENAACTP